jgi:sugar phosphate isomerase/epimerase
MKLGLSTWSLLSLDVNSAVRAIGDSGLEYVELWGEVPHAYPGWVDKKRLRDTLSTYDMLLTVHAPFTDLNPASPFEPVKAAVERTLMEFVEFSIYLGAKMVTVHPGSVHNELLIPQSAGSAVGALRKMIRAAGGRLSINIENQAKSASKYHFPLASTEESLELILADTEGSLCTLDTGHAHVNGQDPTHMAERVGEKLAEVHLCDNSGEADEHLIPGRGTAKLTSLLRRVSETEVPLCLELNPHLYSQEEVFRSLEEVRPMLTSSSV